MTGNSYPLEIDCHAVKRQLDSHEPVYLLDCRERNEYELVHLADARLLPMSQLVERIAELEPERDHDIIVYCHHGGRSLRVASWLRAQGFGKARSMMGGIDRWALDIDPSLPRY